MSTYDNDPEKVNETGKKSQSLSSIPCTRPPEPLICESGTYHLFVLDEGEDSRKICIQRRDDNEIPWHYVEYLEDFYSVPGVFSTDRVREDRFQISIDSFGIRSGAVLEIVRKLEMEL